MEKDYYIRFYLKALENPLFKDVTAWHIWQFCLLQAFPKGVFTIGRNQLEKWSGIKGTTAYKALLRLKNAKMVTIKVTGGSNNRFSEISIVNWAKYQPSLTTSSNNHSNNPVTINEQSSNNPVTHYDKEQGIKNKEKEYNNVETLRVFDLFISSFNKNSNTYKLTDKRKLKIRARLKDAGLEMLEEAIKKTADSKFHNGDNDRGWCADLDFITRSYEQVERLSQLQKSGDEQQKDESNKFLRKVAGYENN